jgi:hypothetical protein
VGCRVDQQRGLAAFDVDGVDEQVVCCIRLGAGDLWEREQGNTADEDGQARQKPAAKMYEAGIGGNSHVRKSVHAKRVGGEGLFVVAEGAVAGVAGVN